MVLHMPIIPVDIMHMPVLMQGMDMPSFMHIMFMLYHSNTQRGKGLRSGIMSHCKYT
jgi:hypothetical protein